MRNATGISLRECARGSYRKKKAAGKFFSSPEAVPREGAYRSPAGRGTQKMASYIGLVSKIPPDCAQKLSSSRYSPFSGTIHDAPA